MKKIHTKLLTALGLVSIVTLSGCSSMMSRSDTPADVIETNPTQSERLDTLFQGDKNIYFSELEKTIQGKSVSIAPHHYIRALEEYNNQQHEAIWMQTAWLYLNEKQHNQRKLNKSDRKLLNFYSHKAATSTSATYSEHLKHLCRNLSQEKVCEQ